jgi:hypothetical protein
MDLDATSLILMVALLLAPAALFVTIFTILRKRRSTFHGQRTSRKPSKS